MDLDMCWAELDAAAKYLDLTTNKIRKLYI